MPYTFLSDEWLDAVSALRESIPDLGDPEFVADLSVNLCVVNGPAAGSQHFHIFGSSELVRGELTEAKTTVTMGFDTARNLFVSANAAAALEAFMLGELEIEGDVAGLMGLQEAIFDLSPAQAEFHERIQEITEGMSSSEN